VCLFKSYFFGVSKARITKIPRSNRLDWKKSDILERDIQSDYMDFINIKSYFDMDNLGALIFLNKYDCRNCRPDENFLDKGFFFLQKSL